MGQRRSLSDVFGTVRSTLFDHRNRALPILRWYFSRVGPDGCAVMDEDWDNLLLLDGCRYDEFAARSSLPGRLETRTSKGSSTAEFLREAISSERCTDTVYVTANPMHATGDYWAELDVSSSFYDVVNVWKRAWDESVGSVWPEDVVDAALSAEQAYPDKRLLVHFVQPHYPFLGETGRKIPHRGGEESRRAALGERAPDGRDAGETGDLDKQIWAQLRDGDVERDTVVRAYRENLDLVLPHVERLLSGLRGRTVVSADHGNHFGERPGPFPFRVYGHPPGLATPELVTVPWLVHDGDERKETLAEDPSKSGVDDERDMAIERIRSLGYVE